MLLSLKWLQEFVPFEGTAEELGERLTMLGLELEDLHRPYDAIAPMVVGHVLTCTPHSQSDHLSVCTVDVGQGEPLPIVCGAPNVAAGQKVPVALVGTTMPDGMVIKKAKLRGEVSCGMICSERELGLSEDHGGILVLPQNFTPGARLVDVLDLDMDVLELGITPNRGDCLSVVGLARETALAFQLPLTLPQVVLNEQGADWSSEFGVHVPDGTLCPMYQLRLIEGITVQPSPANIRYRLHGVGIRPISNVVDVTNTILMELGQPLHAFDRNKVEGGRIEVSVACEGERLVTLDGQERVLSSHDLLIRDGVKPVAMAGVMGGLDSEITAESRDVLMECAIFRSATVRKTVRRTGLSSEASYRYERGVDQGGSTYAMNRAAALMAHVSGGVVRTGVCRNESLPWVAPVVTFRTKRAVTLLGMDLSATFCHDTFTRLGCELKPVADKSAPTATTQAETWQVTTPSWRYDLSREADLIEEVARVHGMDTLPETLPAISRPLQRSGEPESLYSFIMRVKQWGLGLGLNESENYSFVGQKDLDMLGLPKAGRIGIMNPLSEDQNVLRTALIPGLLNNVRHNIAHGNVGLRLFEVANAFTADPTSPTTACEQPRLAVVMHGTLRDRSWPDVEIDADYVDMRGVVDHFVSFLHLPAPDYAVSEHPYLAPCVQVRVQGEDVGVVGRLKPQLADAYHARKAVWTAELDLERLRAMHVKAKIVFKALPVFPATSRDMTVMIPRTLSVSAVQALVVEMQVKFLESCVLVDLFEPKDSDERNLTFRLTFRHAERTLKDAEVDKEREKIAALLVEKLGVRV